MRQNLRQWSSKFVPQPVKTDVNKFERSLSQRSEVSSDAVHFIDVPSANERLREVEIVLEKMVDKFKDQEIVVKSIKAAVKQIKKGERGLDRDHDESELA